MRKMTYNQKELLRLLKRHGKMTSTMMVEETGKEKRIVKNALRSLMKREEVEKIYNLNDMRCPYYRVSEV